MVEKKKTKQKYLDSSKKWKKENKERTNKTRREWAKRNPHKAKESRDKHRFGGNVQAVLERDNFECQDCGMTQEQHIIIFNKRLDIHHIDGFGKNAPKEIKNNDMLNLITLCHRCHAKISNVERMEQRWGDLVKQDDSNWKYPKIRYLVEAEIEKGAGVQEAKRIVSKETGMSFTLIDHRYYDKKDANCTTNEMEGKNGRF